MRASIVIASFNEGDRLWKTARSVLATTRGLDCEVVVADDGSQDGSLLELRKRYPDVRIVAHKKRKGCSPTKHLGAGASKGDVVVFLDGHCKPERGAIEKLVADVESQDGEAIVAPRVSALDDRTWRNSKDSFGQCFLLDLVDFDCRWTGLKGMWMRGAFHESPAFCGCCAAMSRELYEKVLGFDRHMLEWGVEDMDFALKSWLMGYPVLHDPRAVIGHRFRARFDNFTVTHERILVNKLRMARKNFTDPVWKEWREKCRARQPRDLWQTAWKLYLEDEKSVERERKYLHSHRVHDEFWYARRFDLEWPRASSAAGRGR